MTGERCPTCGSSVWTSSTTEGTHFFRPVAEETKDESLSVAEMARILSPAPLITDAMVERAARALHEVSDDVFPFDLPNPGEWAGLDAQLDRFVQRRERYLTDARAALQAALGGTDV